MALAQLRQQLPNLRDYTDDELLAVVAQSQGIASGTPQYDQLSKFLLGYDRTLGQAVKDTGIGLVQGVVGLGQTAATLGAAAIPGVRAFDNPVVNTLQGASDALDQFKSQGLRNQEAGAQVSGDIAVRDAAARGEGAFGRILAGAKAQGLSYIQNPGLAVQDIAASAPSLVAGAGIGRAVQGGVKALGAAEALAARAGVAGGVSGAATLQGGDVASGTFQQMRQAGANYDTAASGATAAGVRGGAVSLGLAAIPGATTIERSMIRGAAGAGRGGVAGAARGFAGEFAQEGVEEGYGQYAQNAEVGRVDPSVDPYAGVGRAALQGGLSAGPLGGFHGRHAQQHVETPKPRTETGEIDLTGTTEPRTPTYPSYDLRTPAAERQAQAPGLRTFMATPGLDPAGSIPGWLRNPDTVPPSIRANPETSQFSDLGQPVNPVQQTPATFADLVTPQPADPFDTSRLPNQPGTKPGPGPTLPTQGVVQPSRETAAGATDFTTSPGASPELDKVDVTRERGPKNKPQEVDTSGLALAPRGAPSMSQILVALHQANTELGAKNIRKDGQVAQTAATAPLRAVLEAKNPVAKMRELYQDGSHPRDELLDVWHKKLTGQTIAEAKGQPAPDANSAGFVPEPAAQINTQLQALREGRIKVVALGKEEAAKADLKGLNVSAITDSSGASAVVVSRDGKAAQQAKKRAKDVGLKQALGEAKGVVDPTLTSQATPPAEGAVVVQQVDNKTGHVLHEEVAKLADVGKVQKVRGTKQRVVPIEQAMAERKAKAAAEAPAPAPAQQPGEAQVQHVENKTPLAERKISARADGAGAAMDGEGIAANPHKPGTPEHTEWLEGYDEVKVRAEAEKVDPVSKQLIDTIESGDTKDEALYNDALYALYKLAADGDVTAFNWFHENGYFNERNDQGDPQKLKPAQRKEMEMLRSRWEQEQADKRGKRFGAAKFDKVAPGEEVNIPRRQLLVGAAALMISGRGTAATVLGKAKPLVLTTMNQKVPAAAEKILRGQGSGKTNIQGAQALKKVMQIIATEGPAEVRALARAIEQLIPEGFPVMLTVTDGDYNAHGAVELAPFVHMRLFNGTHSHGLRYSTVLHESLHLAVAARYRALSSGLVRSNDAKLGVNAPKAAKAMEQFRAVWDEFTEAATEDAINNKGTPLGLSLSEAAGDPDEFFVRSLTDPVLQGWMAKQVYQGKTLWERFKGWVKSSLLGFKEEGTKASWLDAALLASDELLKAMPDDPGDFKRLRASNNLASKRDATDAKFDKATEEKAPTNALAQGARALTATLKAQIKGEELSEPLLNMMTLRQIDEQYGHKLPALREWVSTVMERSSNGSKLAAEADRVALKWQQDVPREEMKPLAEILLRASNAEVQLDNTKPDYVKSLDAEQLKEYNDLRAKLAKLSPAAQEARREALGVLSRQWKYTHDSLKKFITLTVPDPALRKSRLDDLENEFGRNRGDYFPLSRFGDRVVIARGAAKDGRDVVTFHESPKGVEDEVRRLKDSGVKPDNIIVTMSTEYDPRKTPGTGFIRELHSMIDNIADGQEAQTLHQSLQQLYLKSLPELSGAKHMIRRENIEGYSHDALRVFADAVTRGSRYASHLEFGPAVHAAMEAAEAQSRSSDRRTAAVVIGRKEGAAPVVRVVGTGTERLHAVEKLAADGYAPEFFNAHPETASEKLAAALEGATPEQIDGYVKQVKAAVAKSSEGVEDLRAAKQLYNYMVRSQKADIDPHPGKLVELAGQVGYAWYLGFSPAFWAMNTLQNPMVGIPHLGAKYGLTKSSGEWMRAASWFAKVRIGKRLASQTEPFSVEWLREQVKAGELKGINKDELDMLQRLEDHQVLDFTQAMDLSRIGEATNTKWYKAMRLAAAGAHHTEVFNRVSFALAAYRLAMKSRSDMTHDEAVRMAERDVASAHFDYSYANKPLWMGKSAPAMRLVFMFQQYRQHMLYWWANTIKDATKGMTPEERTRARKAALFMGTSQLLFAGTMGLPFIGAVGALASMLAGGDDGEEPFDFERWMRDAAVGMTGSQQAADVVLKGVFAALGADISKRIGQQDLLPLLNPGSARYERNFDDQTRAYLFDMLGPLGSIALGAARATEAFASGDYLRGLVASTPKAVSDILKAYQTQTEGLKDKRGQQLASEEAFDGWDAAFQMAGVTPTSVANAKQAREGVLDVEHEFNDQRKRLTDAFIQSWSRGDQEGMSDALGSIRRYNGNIAKGRFAQKELLITPARLQSAIVNRQRRAMLLALTGGLADTRQQLLIATRMSGLFDLQGRDIKLDGQGLPALPSLSLGGGS